MFKFGCDTTSHATPKDAQPDNAAVAEGDAAAVRYDDLLVYSGSNTPKVMIRVASNFKARNILHTQQNVLCI